MARWQGRENVVVYLAGEIVVDVFVLAANGAVVRVPRGAPSNKMES
jgi:hypothetical protein